MIDQNQKFIDKLKDIYAVSEKLGIKTYIWGGIAVDILNGSFTREHGDLDCFIENLDENITELINRYETLGYQTQYFPDFWMLTIKKGDALATFNSVRNVDGIAHWYHAGPRGTVFFPFDWMDKEPHDFYGAKAYTFGIEMAYTLKNNVRLISPEWKMRDKDKADIAILDQIIAARGINREELLKNVWSHNPYWYAKGYGDYFFPITLK
ncbi:MAG: hypothetical protein FWD90_05255 [Defluviitaleaceae bacterium]|nr:hypothetical protein [Defluviitaleaceae bacterium]